MKAIHFPQGACMTETILYRRQRHLLLTKLLSQFYSVDTQYKFKYDDRFTHTKKAIEEYMTYFSEHIKNGKSMIWLNGKQTAKTSLAFYIAQVLTESGFRVRYEPNLKFLEYLTSKIDCPFEEIYPFSETADLIILDDTEDIFSQLKKEEIYVLNHLFIKRKEFGLPVIFSTRFNKTDIEKMFLNKITNYLFHPRNIILDFNFKNPALSHSTKN